MEEEEFVGTCHACGREVEVAVCPYASEIHDDYETYCCAECSRECAMDI